MLEKRTSGRHNTASGNTQREARTSHTSAVGEAAVVHMRYMRLGAHDAQYRKKRMRNGSSHSSRIGRLWHLPVPRATRFGPEALLFDVVAWLIMQFP